RSAPGRRSAAVVFARNESSSDGAVLPCAKAGAQATRIQNAANAPSIASRQRFGLVTGENLEAMIMRGRQYKARQITLGVTRSVRARGSSAESYQAAGTVSIRPLACTNQARVDACAASSASRRSGATTDNAVDKPSAIVARVAATDTDA